MVFQIKLTHLNFNKLIPRGIPISQRISQMLLQIRYTSDIAILQFPFCIVTEQLLSK